MKASLETLMKNFVLCTEKMFDVFFNYLTMLLLVIYSSHKKIEEGNNSSQRKMFQSTLVIFERLQSQLKDENYIFAFDRTD